MFPWSRLTETSTKKLCCRTLNYLDLGDIENTSAWFDAEGRVDMINGTVFVNYQETLTAGAIVHDHSVKDVNRGCITLTDLLLHQGYQNGDGPLIHLEGILTKTGLMFEEFVVVDCDVLMAQYHHHRIKKTLPSIMSKRAQPRGYVTHGSGFNIYPFYIPAMKPFWKGDPLVLHSTLPWLKIEEDRFINDLPTGRRKLLNKKAGRLGLDEGPVRKKLRRRD